MIAAYVFLLNVITIAALIGVAMFAKWAGWQFCAGAGFGATVVFLWYRMRHGRWPD